jgi:hypothetical protein
MPGGGVIVAQQWNLLLFLWSLFLMLLVFLSLGLAFAGLDTPLPLPSQVILSKPQEH